MAGTAEFQSLIEDPEPQAVARRELCISYFFTTLHASRNIQRIKSTKNSKYSILQHSPD